MYTPPTFFAIPWIGEVVRFGILRYFFLWLLKALSNFSPHGTSKETSGKLCDDPSPQRYPGIILLKLLQLQSCTRNRFRDAVADVSVHYRLPRQLDFPNLARRTYDQSLASRSLSGKEEVRSVDNTIIL